MRTLGLFHRLTTEKLLKLAIKVSSVFSELVPTLHFVGSALPLTALYMCCVLVKLVCIRQKDLNLCASRGNRLVVLAHHLSSPPSARCKKILIQLNVNLVLRAAPCTCIKEMVFHPILRSEDSIS